MGPDSVQNVDRGVERIGGDEPRRRWRPDRIDLAALPAVAAAGALLAWRARFAMNPDGISYLDVGAAYWRGDLAEGWKPLERTTYDHLPLGPRWVQGMTPGGPGDRPDCQGAQRTENGIIPLAKAALIRSRPQGRLPTRR